MAATSVSLYAACFMNSACSVMGEPPELDELPEQAETASTAAAASPSNLQADARPLNEDRIIFPPP
jgi:hypothetical protein